jgi:hypothetical protein
VLKIPGKVQSRPDLLLLLSILSGILLQPVLDHNDFRRVILGIWTFVPIILLTRRLSKVKRLVRPSFLLMFGAIGLTLASAIFPTRALVTTKWGVLTAFFALTIGGLFSYLRSSRAITDAHLYTAASIYLLIGILWFAVYSAIDAVEPDSILLVNTARTTRQSELLYFSLVTLSTIGYGDVVPLNREVRILAALEGITGVLYVAITVALLVGSYMRQNRSG